MIKISSANIDITDCGHQSYKGYMIDECEIKDKLHARLLLIENDGHKYLWINLDECSMRSPFDLALREALSKELGLLPQDLFISCVHTHSGHNYTSMDVNKYKQKIASAYSSLTSQLSPIEAIEETIGQLKNNEIINRRIEISPQLGDACIMFNDGCELDLKEKTLNVTQIINNIRLKNNEEATSTSLTLKGPTDDRIHLWSFKDIHNKTLYNLVRVNCHPVSVSQSKVGKIISADFIRPLQEKISLINNAPTMILNGAFGNTRPFQKEYSFAEREIIATKIATSIKEAKHKTYKNISFNFQEIKISLNLRNEFGNDKLICQNKAKQAGISSSKTPKLEEDRKCAFANFGEEIPPHGSGVLQAEEIKRLEINETFQKWEIGPIKLFCIPGEPLVEFASEIEKQHHYLPIGLSNGYRSYLPHPKDYARGGYEANVNIFSKESLQKIIDLAAHF